MHAESTHLDAAPPPLAECLRGAEERTLTCLHRSRETLERGRAMLAQLQGRESEEIPLAAMRR
jgi:hypothetical protein